MPTGLPRRTVYAKDEVPVEEDKEIAVWADESPIMPERREFLRYGIIATQETNIPERVDCSGRSSQEAIKQFYGGKLPVQPYAPKPIIVLITPRDHIEALAEEILSEIEPIPAR